MTNKQTDLDELNNLVNVHCSELIKTSKIDIRHPVLECLILTCQEWDEGMTILDDLLEGTSPVDPSDLAGLYDMLNDERADEIVSSGLDYIKIPTIECIVRTCRENERAMELMKDLLANPPWKA